MPVFGGYETVRPLFRSGLAEASTAKQVGGDGADRFVVKSYRPFGVDDDEDRLQQGLESFLDGARAQKKAADGGAQYWAAVHEVGTAEGGAYFVTDNHRRSVQHLIRGRVRLSGGRLYQLIRGVIEGLIEFKRACGRPHGNLKPSNVLLTGKSDISRARPLLTDPAPSDRLDPKLGDVPDLHAVGDLIYQLVLHRAGKAMGGWPVPEAKQWEALGKNGAEWRQLCNRLLNPNLAPGLLTFEDLAGDVDKLRERVGGLSAKALAVVAVLVLVAAGAVAVPLLFLNNEEEVVSGTFSGADWKRLCEDFDGWVEPLLGQMQRGDLDPWKKDPYLDKNALQKVGAILKKIDEINPRKIAGSDDTLAWLSEHPTDKAKSQKGVSRTQRALADIDGLRIALSEKGWPACRALAAQAKAFRQPDRGWEGPARFLDTLVHFVPDSRNIVPRVKAVLEANQLLTGIDRKWQSVQALRAEIEAWGQDDIKPLSHFGQYVQDEVREAASGSGAAAMKAIDAKLGELLSAGSLPGRLLSFMQEQRPNAKPLDWPRFRKEPPFAVPDGERLSEAILLRGLARLERGDYKRKPDPRTRMWVASTDESIKKATQGITDLKAEAADVLGEKRYQDALKPQQRTELRAILDANVPAHEADLKRLTGLRQEVDAASIPTYNIDTYRQIDDGIRDVDSGLKALMARVASNSRQVGQVRRDVESTVVGTLDEVKRRLLSKTFAATDIAAIRDAWVKQRDKLLNSESMAKPLQEKSNRLEAFLVNLEGQFERKPIIDEPKSGSWYEALVTTVADRRRRDAVQTCLSYVSNHWDKVLAGQVETVAEFTANRDDQVAKYKAWRAGLEELIPAFNKVETALKEGYLLTGQPPFLKTTLGEYVAEQQKAAVYTDPTVSKALAGIVARVQELKRIDGLSDPQAVLTALADGRKQGHLETVRAAWLRLGKLGKAWLARPTDPQGDVLKEEARLRKDLTALYDLLGDDGRKTALRAELDAQGPRRWEEYFVSRSAAGEVIGAIGRMAEFGVKRDSSRKELTQFRLAMYDLLQALSPPAGEPDDAAVKAAIQAFVGKVERLAVTPADLLRKLKELETAGGGGGMDPKKAGPALLGWAVRAATGDAVTYVGPEKGEAMAFRRVTSQAGQQCFLATTEVSVGLFMAVVQDPKANKWAEVSKLLPIDDDKFGPRVWRGGAQMSLSPEWVPLPPKLTGKMYPAGKDPGPIDPNYPMQQVSLAAAIYFARLMHCRLPTADEWLAAYAEDKKAASAKPYNLRDKTWEDQKAHMVQLQQAKPFPLVDDPRQHFPDGGIFWPSTIPAAQQKKAEAAVARTDAPNDGHLWFAKVDSDTGRPFRNLVGNVAEYVYDDPAAVANIKDMTPEAVTSLLKAQAGGAAGGVIGGSAMSPPAIPDDKPQKLPRPVAAEGYSDVGLRLAFQAGPEPLRSRLLRLLTTVANGGYLPASQ